MVPILSGIIIGAGHSVTRARGLLLASVYVLGMAVTYALAGVAAGLSGAMLAATLQNPWVLGAFAGIFVVLALSMFGFYELQLPVALQPPRRHEQPLRRRSGRGRYLWALSALIVVPARRAPRGGVLYIPERDVVWAVPRCSPWPRMVGRCSPSAPRPGRCSESGPWMKP